MIQLLKKCPVETILKNGINGPTGNCSVEETAKKKVHLYDLLGFKKEKPKTKHLKKQMWE